MRIRLVSAWCTLMAAAPLVAQDPIGQQVVGGLDSKFVEPSCQLPGGGDFRIKSGRTYLKTGIEGTGAAENRVRSLRDGVRVITDAMNTADQGKNPAAWYYLGRLYLQQGNLAGADTAFTRAEALAPGCQADIAHYRSQAWVALVNAGIKFRQAKQDDSALVMLQAANRISKARAFSSLSIGQIYNAKGQKDSALAYFGMAAATTPSDSNDAKARNEALYDQGVLFYNTGKGAEAVTALERYVQLEPADSDGQRVLSKARVLAAGAGGPAPTGNLSDAELYELAVNQYNAKSYAECAATAGRVLQANPYSRDALFLQANAFIALQQWADLGPVAEKLVVIEPLSYFEHKMVVQAYKAGKNTTKMADAVIAGEAINPDVDIKQSQITATGASLTGAATGREARDVNGKPIPPKPVTLVFEFLDKGGAVIGSQEVSVPVLAKDASQPLSIQSSTPGIKGWRYRVK